MEAHSKVIQLKEIIEKALSPIIDRDYIILDVPFYQNIGDVLIWQGTEDFLKNKKYKCHGIYSLGFYHPKIDKSWLIIFMGGGNFGDVWPEHQEYRRNIIREYIDNKIIILPQSVFYQDNHNLVNDAKVFAKHKDLYICARDKYSFAILCDYFTNHLLLLPDMAFCINLHSFPEIKQIESTKDLFVKRCDKEYVDTNSYVLFETRNVLDIYDWPSFTNPPKSYFYRAIINSKLGKFLPSFHQWYARTCFKTDMVKMGIVFLSKYKNIYSTRLHVMILAILLDKKVFVFDNSYGKIRSFYDSWLADIDSVVFLENEK